VARPQPTVVRADGYSATDARPLAAPVVLGRYRLRRRLGAGAIGTVWLAHDERLARAVAVKEVPLGGHPGEGREALAAARLNHPAIVMLYEAGADAERAYLVSELVRGETLGELIARGALSDRDILRIGAVLCDALDHAHAHGVVHRDVKPSNVMVPEEPERGAGVAKLTDFGVAHVAGGEMLTRTGDVVGTLAYMAPEQADGERVGPAADLYALALVLYEALTGTNPVRAAGAAATARRLGSPIPPLLRRRRDLPSRLGEALDLALRARAEERGTVAELRETLADCLREVSDEGGTIAAPPLEALRGRRLRAPGARVAAGLGAGVLVAAALATLVGRPPLAPAAGGLIAAVLVALLPRAGWLAAAVALTGWVASTPGRAGVAVLIALALVAPPLLLRRSGPAWSAPALAPALGLVFLAGAFPALVGQAGSLWRRAALGALGLWWLCLAEAGSGRVLLFGRPPGLAPPAAVGASVARVGHAVALLGSSGVLIAAALWALAAAVLPFLVRGRHLASDLVLGALWAAGLAAGLEALARALPGSAAAPAPRGALAGAAVAAVLAVALARLRPPRLYPSTGVRSMGRRLTHVP